MTTGLLAALKSLENLIMRAELKLGREGLHLRLQSDGSGSIEDVDAAVVLQFDTHDELVEWLKVPTPAVAGRARGAASLSA